MGVDDPVKFASRLAWSPCKIWSLFCVPCGRIGGPKIGGAGTPPLVPDPLEIRPSRHMFPFRIWSFYRSNNTSVGRKMPPPRSAFQSHSKSSELTRIESVRTHDFLLAIYTVTMGLSRTFTTHSQRFRSRIENFPTPVFNAPTDGDSQWNTVSAKDSKTRLVPLFGGQKMLTVV